jgi:hypothetical protein
MSDKVKCLVAAVAVAGFGVLAVANGGIVGAVNCVGADCAKVGANSVSNGQTDDLTGTVNSIINVVIFVIGFVAVAMVILGGVQYSTSSGDSAKVKKAKDTIMYGIIGLIIAILAFAIVNFVLQGVF